MTTRRNIMMASLLLNIFVSHTGFSDAIADKILKDYSRDASAANQPLSTNDSREQQAQDAFDQGTVGGTLASILAAKFFKEAGAQLALGNWPEAAVLFGMAGLESAQAAVNFEAAGLNSDQKRTLNGEVPSALPSAPALAALNSPELNKALSDAGVDPERFKQQVLNGELKSTADVLAALGKSVDAETLAKGQQLAESKAAGIFADVKKKMDEEGAKTLTADTDSKKKNGENTTEDSSAASKGGRELASNEKGDHASELQSSDKNPNANAKEAQLASAKKELEKSGSASGFDMNSLLSKMFGSGSLMDSSDQKAILRQELAQMGIQLPVKGVSIFALAHRQYSEFGKSRGRAKRVALR